MLKLIKAAAVACLLGAATSCLAEERPNVIVIMVDDMGYSDIGCYGGEIHTPNLDSLAQTGMRFRQFYNTGKCHSSRVSLLTGLHSYQAGNSEKDGTVKLHNHEIARGVSIAQVLREVGYATAVSGKWHVSPEPAALGFDHSFGFLNGFIRDYFDSSLLLLNGEKYDSNGRYITDLITEKGIGFIAKAHRNQKPFFLYLPYNAPHFPLQVPQEEIDKYIESYSKGWLDIRERRLEKMKQVGLVGEDWIPADPQEVSLRDWDALSKEEQEYQLKLMATYAGMIDRIDQNIGKLIEKLEELEVYDNTLILFCSDNGASNEAAGGFAREPSELSIPTTQGNSFTTVGPDWAFVSNTPYRFYKAHMHEGGIISPLIVHWPKGISMEGGTLDHQNVFHLIDIMPTIVELCGASYPETFEGKKIEPMNGISMAPAFKGNRAVREGGIYQMFGISRAYRLGEWKIVSHRMHRWELYNMAEDPTEQKDLAEQYPEKVDELKAMWWKVAREDERLPDKVNKPSTNNPAIYNRK